MLFQGKTFMGTIDPPAGERAWRHPDHAYPPFVWVRQPLTGGRAAMRHTWGRVLEYLNPPAEFSVVCPD